jgi:valyl-tRNA synthetase
MSEIPKAYDPKAVEGPILDSWFSEGGFGQAAVEGERPFTVVIPPPNVTGSLHMGHALNNTIQDVVIRRSRMTGRPTRWVLGTDHAGIATQNKVEQKLAAEGLDKHDVGRERFIEMCWEWREEHGSQIVNQLKVMGCSCDYDDEHFTMDPGYRQAVRKVFVDWYDAGLIYRGNRIINWCPRCATALSDIEVEHEDLDSHLWHIRYPLKEPVGGLTHLTVATTRPETMLGDTAVAVGPDDPRYSEVVGATAILPLMEREIPVIADEYVDPSFGTGALKVTPAHDVNDFEIGQRHDLPSVNAFAADATISEAGGRYAGLDRYEARERILADLEERGLIADIDEHVHSVGHCYRCHTVIEPWLSEQWFVDMKPLAKPGIECVKDGRVVFHPKRWENVYFDWMENIRDWCVSRQLWWGHQIPVFYCDACGETVASMDDLTECPACGAPVRQDEDVLDTWFSSQLWPFATLGWPEDTPELACFYPTTALSTARDIIFLWVARMIMSGLYFNGDVPYEDVIIHPTVFNREGRRMSKSLGTGVDPLDLIADYGADAMRFGLMLQTTGNQDIRFMEEKLASSRNFANKIWNASRFVLMNTDDGFEPGPPKAETVADTWILSRLSELGLVVDEGLTTYQFGETARVLHEFFWSEFCDWYIELSKHRLAAGGQTRTQALRNLVYVLDRALRLLHPMMPFITEYIWRRLPLPAEETAEALMWAAWPTDLTGWRDEGAEASMQVLQEVVTAVRAVRARFGLSPKKTIDVVIRASGSDEMLLRAQRSYLEELAGVGSLDISPDAVKPAHSASDIIKGMEIHVLLEGLVDIAAERERIGVELGKIDTDLAKVRGKLANEGFLAKAAPEVVDKQRAKELELVDAEARLRSQLAELAD